MRRLMYRAGPDALLAFPNQSHWDQFQADVRYLSHIGGNQTGAAVVFPAAGEPAAFVRGGNEVEWWSIAQDWVKDFRGLQRSWGEPMIDHVDELNLAAAPIGVSGLSDLRTQEKVSS